MTEEQILISNMQLYELSQNKHLNKEFRLLAQKELANRKLTDEKWNDLKISYQTKYLHKENPLPDSGKLVLMLLPFFILLYNIAAAFMLGKGYERMWKHYLLFVSLGFLFYTIVFLVFAKHFIS